MRFLRSAWTLGVAWLLLSLPRAAEACAVCAGNQDEQSTMAFRYTTAFLSVLPLAMIGGGALWLRRRLRQIEAAEPEITARVPIPR